MLEASLMVDSPISARGLTSCDSADGPAKMFLMFVRNLVPRG